MWRSSVLSFALAAITSALVASCTRESPPASSAPRAERDRDRDRAEGELADAAIVLREMTRSDAIPASERERAHCVIVVPSMVRAALGVGARHGDGVATCRTAGAWSGPVFLTVSGGSAGFQIGVESADVVMLVRGERGMRALFHSRFELGADASAAAGPVGRAAQAATDPTLTAEILSYARARGLFAGVELSGAVVKHDEPALAALYGPRADAHAILAGEVPAPREARDFLEQVRAAFGAPVALGASDR